MLSLRESLSHPLGLLRRQDSNLSHTGLPEQLRERSTLSAAAMNALQMQPQEQPPEKRPDIPFHLFHRGTKNSPVAYKGLSFKCCWFQRNKWLGLKTGKLPTSSARFPPALSPDEEEEKAVTCGGGRATVVVSAGPFPLRFPLQQMTLILSHMRRQVDGS